jgi:hypothetical protein
MKVAWALPVSENPWVYRHLFQVTLKKNSIHGVEVTCLDTDAGGREGSKAPFVQDVVKALFKRLMSSGCDLSCLKAGTRTPIKHR